MIREGERTAKILVREFGFNDYQRVTGFDFAPATAYWNGTQAFWARVRTQWDQRIAAGSGIHLKTKVDGMPLIAPLFVMADAAKEGKGVDNALIADVFDQWTVAAPQPLASAGPSSGG